MTEEQLQQALQRDREHRRETLLKARENLDSALDSLASLPLSVTTAEVIKTLRRAREKISAEYLASTY